MVRLLWTRLHFTTFNRPQMVPITTFRLRFFVPIQIVSHKLEFDKTAKSKIGSLKNAQHRAGGGDVQIFREQLPWLKYNKPNLPPEERARINKQRSLSHSEMSNSINSSST
ncbi:hypothetical protein T265_08895 [Opisthorchis viverrini]|uniref:Microtubule-associated protein n=1 Tax=Opisthorchis viverrini TaxID=6198 RepID=A0A074Z7W1_OPIVI|nr:hypothetical protein T265_08895 [Opisthorchis viverrini]KER23163.1 hypothetical protein T265_08895 [Opisthorchis viverrini]